MVTYEERSQTPSQGSTSQAYGDGKGMLLYFFVEDEEIVGSRMKVRGFIYC